jgi:hypothetical protein
MWSVEEKKLMLLSGMAGRDIVDIDTKLRILSLAHQTTQ